jgi:hypothetical protein
VRSVLLVAYGAPALNGEIVLWWKNVPPEGDVTKFLAIPVVMYCWDSRGMRHETRYNLFAIESAKNTAIIDEIAPSVALTNRTTVSRMARTLKRKPSYRAFQRAYVDCFRERNIDLGVFSATIPMGSRFKLFKDTGGDMADRKAAQQDKSEASETTSDVIEQQVVAFAEQLGGLVGTVQAKTEGWLDRKTLSEQISRIRDSAAELLEHVRQGEDRSTRKTGSSQTAPAATRPSRGAVDAPGKRHRKPLPQESINKLMGEPRGKQMGQKSQKSAKTGRRGGRR